MAKLPIFSSEDPAVSLLQTRWASIIEPSINNPILAGNLLKNVELNNGLTQVNHKLGRKLQGWIITRQRGISAIHDQQDSNTMPELTLTLASSAGVNVDIYVF